MSRVDRNEQASDLVMRDLVDTLIQENLGQFADRAQPDPSSALAGETLQPGEQWCRIDLAGAWVCFRARPAAALQPYRLSRPPVWHGASHDDQPRRLEPDELLELLASARQGLAGQQLIDRCPVLRARVQLCDERTWCGWHHPSDTDEFDDRRGQLAAQLRVYLAGLFDDPARLVLPMATLAAHEWDVLGTVIGPAGFGPADAVEFFRRLVEAFCEVGLGFLRYGVLHGQNVVVALQDGVPHRFVLRDHDTLRLYPDWMIAAGVPDPGYRIAPGARQSLRLSCPEELLGYLQTLGSRSTCTASRTRWGGTSGLTSARCGRSCGRRSSLRSPESRCPVRSLKWSNTSFYAPRRGQTGWCWGRCCAAGDPAA